MCAVWLLLRARVLTLASILRCSWMCVCVCSRPIRQATDIRSVPMLGKAPTFSNAAEVSRWVDLPARALLDAEGRGRVEPEGAGAGLAPVASLATQPAAEEGTGATPVVATRSGGSVGVGAGGEAGAGCGGGSAAGAGVGGSTGACVSGCRGDTTGSGARRGSPRSRKPRNMSAATVRQRRAVVVSDSSSSGSGDSDTDGSSTSAAAPADGDGTPTADDSGSEDDGDDDNAMLLVPACFKPGTPMRFALTVLSQQPVSITRLDRACVESGGTPPRTVHRFSRLRAECAGQKLKWAAKRRHKPPKPVVTKKRPVVRRPKVVRRRVNPFKDAQKSVAGIGDMYAMLGQ